jgi:hypothetical protein
MARNNDVRQRSPSETRDVPPRFQIHRMCLLDFLESEVKGHNDKRHLPDQENLLAYKLVEASIYNPGGWCSVDELIQALWPPELKEITREGKDGIKKRVKKWVQYLPHDPYTRVSDIKTDLLKLITAVHPCDNIIVSKRINIGGQIVLAYRFTVYSACTFTKGFITE